MIASLRPFLPRLRPIACVPDGPSAMLAHNLGVESLMRLPAPVAEFGSLLDAVAWQADLVIMDGTKEADPATLAQSFTAFLSFLSVRGDLLMLVTAESEKSLFGNLLVPSYRRSDTEPPCHKLGGHAWLRIADSQTGIVALFFARCHHGEEPQRLSLDRTTEAELTQKARLRPLWRNGPGVFEECDRCRHSHGDFAAALTEWHRRAGATVSEPHPYNLWLDAGVIHVWLDPYQSRLQSLKLQDDALCALRGYTVGAIVAGGTHASTLKSALSNAALRVSSELREAVEKANLVSAQKRAPFYALPPLQRLGWLIDHDSLTCTESFGPFRKGHSYRLQCVPTEFTRATTRQNLFGEEENVILHAKDLVFEIIAKGSEVHRFANWSGRKIKNGLNYVSQHDLQTRHSLTALCEHFEIPTVADVATLFPKRYQRALDILDEIEREAQRRNDETRMTNDEPGSASSSSLVIRPSSFSWRQFQRDDLARFSLHRGGVFAWDKGGGKGLALLAIPWLYRAHRVLIVAPEGLHDQICTEWTAKFGFAPRRIMSTVDVDADADLKAALVAPRAKWQPIADGQRPQYWLTSYTALGFNGADEWKDEVDEDSGERLISKRLLKTRLTQGLIPKVGDVGIGEQRTLKVSETEFHTVRCVNRPSLATLLADAFDCVECDEAVRLKSTDSYISLGVRRMRPRFPVALTGTPVKNRLEDIFWLAHWASGSPAEGNSRFPYPDNSQARERFADTFMVMEENLTRRDKYRLANPGRSKKFTRRLPQATNVHALWRVLGGIVLRRRKEDFGEDIVTKSIVPVSVKPGRAQQEVYRFHLANPPTHNANGEPMTPAAGLLAQLNNLRQAALSPDAPSLSRRLNDEARMTNDDGARDASSGSSFVNLVSSFPASRSWSDQTPLFVGACELIEQRLAAGEQVMVASPFTFFNVNLEARLRDAGISCVRLDGETQATERGRLARDFKARRFSVLIAGQQAMGEGHSFDQCSTLIQVSLHWAFDINSQVEDRVHRLTSRKPVTIYVLSVENTISEQLLALYREKSAASAAAVDGRLFSDPNEEEISLGQLLRNAHEHFNAATETVDEALLESEWPQLRDRLRAAEAAFRTVHPLVHAESTEKKTEKKEKKQRTSSPPSELRAAPCSGASPCELSPAQIPLAPPRTPLAATIRNLPAMTFAALQGTSDAARIATVRRQFEAFAVTQKHTGWQAAWTAFQRLPMAKRERFTHVNPEPTNPIEETLAALV